MISLRGRFRQRGVSVQVPTGSVLCEGSSRLTIVLGGRGLVMDDGSGIILLAEDNRDDEEFFRRALQRNGSNNPVHAVQSGEEAIKYLAGEGQYADRAKYPLPKLAALDSKMPGKT